MTHSTRLLNKKLIKWLPAAIFWVAVWQIVSLAVDLPLLLPGPYAVIKTLILSLSDAEFWKCVLLTLLRVLGGFIMGSMCGFILAVLTQFVPFLGILLVPAVRVIRATPVASFILLCALWLTSGFLPAFIVGLMVLPVVWGNVTEGFQQTDRQLLEMAKLFELHPMKTFLLIYLPSAFPYFQSACITSLGLAWKSGVAAEVLSQPRVSVGTQLYYAKIYLETEQLFAWTAVVIALSILVEHIFVKLINRISIKKAGG